MSAVQKPESDSPSRDLAMSPAGRARLAEIRARNALVVALNNESWGAKLTHLQQRAFAEYMRRFSLDISEVDNLGGRPYRNARYYQRRLAELAAQGKIEWMRGDHIGPDARLAEMAKDGDTWAQEEDVRRVRLRIAHGVPADATHAYVVTIKMKSLGLPLDGVKYILPRGSTGRADPIGASDPVTTVETRAWRRAGRLVAAEIPELRRDEEIMDEAEVETEEVVLDEAVRAEDRNAAATITPKPLATADGDAYALNAGTAPMREVQLTDRISVTPEPEPDFDFQDDRDIA